MTYVVSVIHLNEQKHCCCCRRQFPFRHRELEWSRSCWSKMEVKLSLDRSCLSYD